MLAQQQYDRAAALAGKNFASNQQLDESTASLAKAKAELELKRAEAAEASAGPTAEERALADARVALAEATVAKLQAQLDKTVLTAPVDGTIGIRVAEPGEIIGPGKPVMTLDAGQPWFAFTLREDALHGLTIGTTVALSAQGGRNCRCPRDGAAPAGRIRDLARRPRGRRPRPQCLPRQARSDRQH